jgi:hypothetical protein
VHVSVPVWYQKEEQCRLRADRTSCLVTRPMGQIETILLLQATLVFALELSAHYLHLSYSTPRRYLRLVFYVEYGACCLAVLVITVLICIWLLLGVLILPSKVLPYAAGRPRSLSRSRPLLALLYPMSCSAQARPHTHARTCRTGAFSVMFDQCWSI